MTDIDLHIEKFTEKIEKDVNLQKRNREKDV